MPIDRAAEDRFRREVWIRDKGLDRATGRPLERSSDNPHVKGEVCHLKPKGPYPELRHVVSNAVLMSAENHRQSDARGGKKLQLIDPKTGEPATDASKPILFRMCDRRGVVLWSRIK